ncbi:hypothetical protein C0989_009484 [Termitomyces sp. Mn162]|nr:hypothetical protein C0989_009484 [Termitomyces sp. Mn162]
MAHAALSLSATKKYHTTQEDLSALLNLALLNDPADFFSHVRLAAGRIVLAVTYGLSAEIADRKVSMFPDLYLSSSIERLNSISHKQKKLWRSLERRLFLGPIFAIYSQSREGTALPSLTHDLLMNTPAKDRAGHEYRVKWTAGSMFGGEFIVLTMNSISVIIDMPFPPKPAERL